MHRLLKPTGSILIHCDWHANTYIRVYILDKLFGLKNFRNEIIWYYNRWTNVSKQFQNMHDTIFWYSKSNHYTFNKNGKEPSDSQIKKFEKGWDQNVVKTSGGNKITQYIVYDIKKFESKCKPKPNSRIVYRLTKDFKVAPSDVIEIPIINSQAKERIGYPTQKPETLLNTLVYTLSNENDTVLDPFVGGGTTVVVAEKLGRNWIGIDQSVAAVKVTEMRINKEQNMFSKPYTLQLHKYDYDTLRFKDAFEFETWIVERFDGIPNIKQRSDFGMDGKMRNGTPIQVKRSDGIGRNVVDNFISACKRYDNKLFEKNKKAGEPVGYIIAFSFSKGAIQEIARLRNEENTLIQLVTVEEIVPMAKRPKLTVNIIDIDATQITSSEDKSKALREIEFIANAESDAGVEFYAFDFEYNEETGIFVAEQMLNKEGIARHKFKAGTHTIAIKAVDNEGLEAIEILRLKVNGEIEIE